MKKDSIDTNIDLQFSEETSKSSTLEKQSTFSSRGSKANSLKKDIRSYIDNRKESASPPLESQSCSVTPKSSSIKSDPRMHFAESQESVIITTSKTDSAFAESHSSSSISRGLKNESAIKSYHIDDEKKNTSRVPSRDQNRESRVPSLESQGSVVSSSPSKSDGARKDTLDSQTGSFVSKDSARWDSRLSSLESQGSLTASSLSSKTDEATIDVGSSIESQAGLLNLKESNREHDKTSGIDSSSSCSTAKRDASTSVMETPTNTAHSNSRGDSLKKRLHGLSSDNLQGSTHIGAGSSATSPQPCRQVVRGLCSLSIDFCFSNQIEGTVIFCFNKNSSLFITS